jgi:hypothetical protein
MRLSAVLVLCLTLPCVPQDTKSSTPAFDSEDTLRRLAASVNPGRILARVTELCAFGPRPPASQAASGAHAWMKDQLASAGLADARVAGGGEAPAPAWVSASFGRRDAPRHVVVSSGLTTAAGTPGAHASGAGASALLEAARVLQASRATNQIAELPFEVRFEIDRPGDGPAGSRPSVAPFAEIRFGELGLGTKRDCLFVIVSAPAGAVPAFVARLEAVLAKWKGEKGFWREFEVLADPAPARTDGATRVTLSCTAPEGAAVIGPGAAGSKTSGDSCPVAGTADDTPSRTVAAEPQNAVNAVRFALFAIAHLAVEQPAR